MELLAKYLAVLLLLGSSWTVVLCQKETQQPCIKDVDSYSVLTDTLGSDSRLVPLGALIDCLSKVEIPEKLAVDFIDSFDGVMRQGYGYYYFNDDVLKSSPISNPFDWEIYSGYSGGQVNYSKEFENMILRVQRDGKANGMLAYQVNDVLMRARDAHTNGVVWDLDGLVLISDTFADTGESRWLSLRMDDASNDVQVISRVGQEGKDTKVVISINGEDPLMFLRDLTSNPSIGASAQFKSPGVRMNVFLQSFNTIPDTPLVWISNQAGDISNIPERLEIEYDDGSKDIWSFRILVPEETAGLDLDAFSAIMRQESDVYQSFQALIGDGGVTRNTTKTTRLWSPRKMPRKSMDDVIYNRDLLNFTDWYDGNETFSSYAVYDDVMVWKLPTFDYPEDAALLIEFWNAMVEEAEEQRISKILIDISDNGGGFIHNAYRILAMLYPNASPDMYIHEFNVRITPSMIALDDAYEYFKDLMDALLQDNVTISALDDVDDAKLYDALEVVEAISGLSVKSLNQADSLLSIDAWYTSSIGDVATIVDDLDILQNGIASFDEQNILEFLQSLENSIIPPTFCTENPGECEKGWVTTQNQGGTQVLVSNPERAGETTVEFLDSFVDEALFNGSGNSIKKSPFESIVLLSNSAIVGSAANMLESGLRHVSRVSGDVPVTTVSMGCFGNASECDMTSFQGIVQEGNGQLANSYLVYLSLALLENIIDLLPRDTLGQLGITEANVSTYKNLTQQYKDSLVPPPSLTQSLPQYNAYPIYSLDLGNTSIPQEYFARPADAYLAIWTPPGGMSLDSGNSLPEVYSEAVQFFQKSTAGDLEVPGKESSNSHGISLVSVMLACLLVVICQATW